MSKAVVFDLDGTLIDSLPDIADSIQDMLKKFNHPLISYNAIMQNTGDGARNLVKRCLPAGLSEQEIDERLYYYNDIYTNSGSPKTCVFAGIKEMLVELKKRGYKIGVLTNKPQMTTDVVFEKLFSDVDIDAVVGQHAGMKIKPDPTMLLQILSNFGVEKQNAYFVGDGEPDAQIAINAGINGISELWGYRTKEQLMKAGATVFVNTPDELLQLLK